MTSFAALAFVLAVIGTYGVVSFIATSRTREFAIRVALGADRARVTRLVFAQAARLTAIGLAVGVVAARAAAPLLQAMPVGVRSPDLLIIAPAALLIGAVAMAACYVPARRATTVDPSAALRCESASGLSP